MQIFKDTGASKASKASKEIEWLEMMIRWRSLDIEFYQQRLEFWKSLQAGEECKE